MSGGGNGGGGGAMAAAAGAGLSYDRLYSLSEIDEVVMGQIGRVRYTVADVVLFLLYADPLPIQGRDRVMLEVFLALREILPDAGVEPVEFRPKRLGPHSRHVEDTIEQMVFANYASVSGGYGSECRLHITPKGRAYVAGRFSALPRAVRERLARKRREWDTLTPGGLARYACVHNPEYLEASAYGGRRAGGRAE